MNQARPEALRSALIRLSARLAHGSPAPLRQALEEADGLEEPRAVEETILQSYLFLGYPAALNAFGLWRKVSGQKAPPDVDDDWESWSRRGEEVCRIVYGGQYERLRRNVRDLHPDMERWMVAEGYGKVLGRPGLDLMTRELCISALLAVLGASRQLYSHLRGARNAGAKDSEVEEALSVACEDLDAQASADVHEVWNQILARSGPMTDPPGVD